MQWGIRGNQKLTVLFGKFIYHTILMDHPVLHVGAYWHGILAMRYIE